ncbi:MAG: hypothetical protein JWP76_2172 [Dactylosporangium sp.]|nr:hypothetical protein [Dactylosporangium sp.]
MTEFGLTRSLRPVILKIAYLQQCPFARVELMPALRGRVPSGFAWLSKPAPRSVRRGIEPVGATWRSGRRIDADWRNVGTSAERCSNAIPRRYQCHRCATWCRALPFGKPYPQADRAPTGPRRGSARSTREGPAQGWVGSHWRRYHGHSDHGGCRAGPVARERQPRLGQPGYQWWRQPFRGRRPWCGADTNSDTVSGADGSIRAAACPRTRLDASAGLLFVGPA